jgi:hypothetical protein
VLTTTDQDVDSNCKISHLTYFPSARNLSRRRRISYKSSFSGQLPTVTIPVRASLSW